MASDSELAATEGEAVDVVAGSGSGAEGEVRSASVPPAESMRDGAAAAGGEAGSTSIAAGASTDGVPSTSASAGVDGGASRGTAVVDPTAAGRPNASAGMARCQPVQMRSGSAIRSRFRSWISVQRNPEPRWVSAMAQRLSPRCTT